MTTPKSIELTILDGNIACVTLDMPGSGANILSDQMLTELQECQDQIRSKSDIQGLILISAKPKIFVAGANLKQIHAALDWSDELIIEFAHRGRKIYDAFSQFSFPSVAAIHGACVGGGLELALGCHRRVATTDRRSIFGLPETNLGLIPGWAGTVRVPRITGLKKGLELVVSGQTFPSSTAMELGLVDQLVDSQAELIPAALQMIQSENESKHYSTTPQSKIPLELSDQERTTIASEVPAEGLAQEVVMRHILASCGMEFEDACHSEANAFAETWGSEQSHGLLNNFFLGEHNKKNPGFINVTPSDHPITQVGIVGAGTMGQGIAASCLKSGLQVMILDLDTDVAEQVAQQLGGPEKGIQAIPDVQSFQECQMVIESITENLQAKQQTLAAIDAACPPSTVIASNTSSIPISELATDLAHPQRFCGIHFCHPKRMRVVEVVRGQATSEATTNSAVNFVRGLRKLPVIVKDGPGFVVNRVLSAMFDQAIQQFTRGSTIAQIDDALRQFGFDAGPFEMMDLIGIDTCLMAGQAMGQRGIRCVNDSPIIPRMVKRKRLGRKSGAGFYRYSDQTAVNDPEVDRLLADYVDQRPSESSDSHQQTDGPGSIADSILAAMTLEATRILDEGLVSDPRDVDICLIHGLSFPAEKGGLLFWAGRTGIQSVRELITQLGNQDSKYKMSDSLNQMEATGSFY